MDAHVFAEILPFWIRAFVFSLVVEVPIFVLVARLGASGERTCPVWRQGLAGAVGTCITHPFLWFVWSQWIADYDRYVVSGELIVAAVESVTFWAIARPIPLSRAIAASFIANAVSYGGGAALRALGVWG